MKYFAVLAVLCGIGYFIYSDRVEREAKEIRLAGLVSRAERLDTCRQHFDWLPSEGETVRISVDGSTGMVVLVAFDMIESFEFDWSLNERVDPDDCEVFGVDVRTSQTRVREENSEGTTERITEPYAVVRFKLFELSPLSEESELRQ